MEGSGKVEPEQTTEGAAPENKNDGAAPAPAAAPAPSPAVFSGGGKQDEESYSRLELLLNVFADHPFISRIRESETTQKTIQSMSNEQFAKLVEALQGAHAARKRVLKIDSLDSVVELIRRSKKVLVLTGAGVSTSAGIPDFRSPDGVYATCGYKLKEPQDLFSIHYFRRNIKPFYDFARKLYPGTHKPAPTHLFIKKLEDEGLLVRNYSQNIDTLEHVAGVKRVLQCHGSFASASCTRCKYKCSGSDIKADIMNQTPPLCPKCVESPKPSLVLEFAMRDPSMRAFRVPGDRSVSMSSESDDDTSTSPRGFLVPAITTPRALLSASLASTSAVVESPATTPRNSKPPPASTSSVSSSSSTSSSSTSVGAKGKLSLNTASSPKGPAAPFKEPDSPFTSSARRIHGKFLNDTHSVVSEDETALSYALTRVSSLENLPRLDEDIQSSSTTVPPVSARTLSDIQLIPRRMRSHSLGNDSEDSLINENEEAAPKNGPDSVGSSSSSKVVEGSSSDDKFGDVITSEGVDGSMNFRQNNNIRSHTVSSVVDIDAKRQQEMITGQVVVDDEEEEEAAPMPAPAAKPKDGLVMAEEDLPFIDPMFDKGIMKPDIVFFGESLPSAFFDCLEDDVKSCDLVFVLGTSLKVAPVSRIIGKCALR